MTEAEQPAGAAARRLPYFASSPVVEVVLSVAFQPLGRVRTVELVHLWDALFRPTFGRGEEQPPYLMPIEQLGEPQPSTLQIQLLQGPVATRLWLFDGEGDQSTQVVQLQNSYFARNWRKTAEVAYPRYRSLRAPFRDDLVRVIEYLAAQQLGDLRPTQCELTYISHIDAPGGLPQVLALLSPRPGADAEAIPVAESMRFAAQFPIPHGDTHAGRLHFSAEPALRRENNAPIVITNLTARGAPIGGGVDGVMAFLDLAHEHAVTTFDSMTTSEMHVAWGRTDER